MLIHWKDPLHNLVALLDRGLESALNIGDYAPGSFCLANRLVINIYEGSNLPDLEEALRYDIDRIYGGGLKDPRTAWVQPPIQYVLNMQQRPELWRDLTILTGEMMNESAFVDHAVEGKHAVLLSLLWMMKLQLAYYFGFYSDAHACLGELVAVGKANRFHFNFLFLQFFGGLTHLELYRTTGKRIHRAAARRHINVLKRIESQGCPNTSSLLCLLAAEEVACTSNSRHRSHGKVDAVVLYQRAIDTMANVEWVHLEGLANERLAFYLARHDRQDEAREHFRRAMILYRDKWGSLAKYEWLHSQSRVFMGLEEESHQSRVGDIIDLRKRED
jgi:hypothetical protein